MTQVATPSSFGIQGKARHRNDDEVIALALLFMGDLIAAADYWRRLAPSEYRIIVDATTEPGTAKLPQWDGEQYISRARSIDPLDIRQAVLQFIAASQNEARGETDALTSGLMPLEQWQANGNDRIKRVNLATAMIAFGGFSQTQLGELSATVEGVPETVSEQATLGDIVLYQLGRFQRFAEQIEDKDRSANTAGKIEARTNLYGASAYPTFEHARKIAAMTANKTHERNVLSKADHCQADEDSDTPDCPSMTKLGLVRIGTLTPVGQRICGPNCKCRIEYE